MPASRAQEERERGRDERPAGGPRATSSDATVGRSCRVPTGAWQGEIHGERVIRS